MLKFEPTDHSYYCSLENDMFLEEYETFDAYLQHWDLSKNLMGFDISDMLDFNFLIRYDLAYPLDEDGEEILNADYLKLTLFYIKQRHGGFVPLVIKRLYKEDMEKLNEILEQHAAYMKKMWCEYLC